MSIKIAAPTDQNFEQSFFQLAYDKLQEKLHNLLPFLVGFEVVNKSDDGTKALGVFGFKSGNGQILFAPAFFVNGSVKDLDLLYSKDNEQFYPLNEDWAEMFLKDDTTGMGDVSVSSKQDLQKNMPYVDFRNFVTPPRTGKTSFASVIDYVENGDNKIKTAFLSLMEHEKYGADFTEAILRYYPMEKVAAALVPKKMPAMDTKQETPIQVIRPADTAAATKLTPEQKKEMLSKGYIIVDNRKQEHKSHVGIFKFKEKFQNPEKSGFYTYLTSVGMLRYGLVLNKPFSLMMGFPSSDSMVIDIDSKEKTSTYTVPNSQVFVKDHIEVPDFKEVVDMMVDPAEVDPGYSNQYILINDKLKCSVPFTVSQNFKDANGVRRIVVDRFSSSDVGGDDRPKAINRYKDHPKRSVVDKKYNSQIHQIVLVFTKKNSDTIEFRNNLVYIPKGFKLLKVDSHGSYDDKDRKNNTPGGLCSLNGSLSDKSVFPFTLRTNGSEYFVNMGSAKKSYRNPVEAKIALVVEYGIDEKVGEDLLGTLIPDIEAKGYIKLAYLGDESLPLIDEQASTNNLGQPEYHGIPYQQSAGTSDGYTGDPTQLGLGVKPDTDDQGVEGDVQNAVDLAGSGQKEIFDTQTIATLSKYVNPTEKSVAYTPDFVTALDKLGRMLFLIYWETDKFKEMYGRDELPELVELLRNVFKNMGDLVIFLKRKFPDLSINNNQESQEGL